jgi:hypothetical protein
VRQVEDFAYVEDMRDTSGCSAKTGRQEQFEDVEVDAGIVA